MDAGEHSPPQPTTRAPGSTHPEASDAPRASRVKPSVPAAFGRFAAVGASGVGVNLGMLWLLLHGPVALAAEGPFPAASAIATETAILWNYAGNELWTYHLRRLSLRRLAKFNAAALVALVLTVTVATLTAEAAPPLLAQLAGIAVGSGANFAAHFGWVWRR